jgi:hypothetical protein
VVGISGGAIIRWFNIRLGFLSVHSDLDFRVLPLVGFVVVVSLAAAKALLTATRNQPIGDICEVWAGEGHVVIHTGHGSKPIDEVHCLGLLESEFWTEGFRSDIAHVTLDS